MPDGAGWLQMHLGVYSEPLFTVFVTGALLATVTALPGHRVAGVRRSSW